MVGFKYCANFQKIQMFLTQPEYEKEMKRKWKQRKENVCKLQKRVYDTASINWCIFFQKFNVSFSFGLEFWKYYQLQHIYRWNNKKAPKISCSNHILINMVNLGLHERTLMGFLR